MSCSDAQREANRKNAARSTGPKTVEGKERSRANSLKHGMTGDGVVLREEDQTEVAKLAGQLEAEMKPTAAIGRILLKRVAVLAVRLDHCVEYDQATTARRVRDAGPAHDDEKRAEVRALFEGIAADPAHVVARLKTTPQGVARLVKAWLALLGDLVQPLRDVWSSEHVDRVENLLGRDPGEYPLTSLSAFCRAGCGDFSGIDPNQAGHLPLVERKAWAREQVKRMIEVEVESLRSLASGLDDDADALDRAQAGQRALFDPSKEGDRVRKYEAAAERGLFRALREFRQVEKDAQVAAETVVEAPAVAPMGSFSQDEHEPTDAELIWMMEQSSPMSQVERGNLDRVGDFHSNPE